ncbi:MAG: Ig-like domain-containing protein, partial [Woeseiaceae bacterium]
MRKRIYFTALVAMLFVAACSGSGDGFIGNVVVPPPTTPGGTITVSAVSVLASSPSLPSDAGQELNITVVVRDENNVAVGGVTVILSSDSGTLTVTDPVTDANGIVTATINSGGDPSNRAITISADANGVI